MPEPPVHVSTAWLLTGIATIPGLLALRAGRLLFISERGVVFDVPLAAATDLTFPWYYFSGGFKVTAGGIHRRISLTRPNGAPRPSASLAAFVGLPGGDLLAAAGSLRDVGEGRAAGKAWRALLTGGATTATAG